MNKGLTSLVAILIITAVTFMMASTALLSGLGEAQNNLRYQLSKKTFLAADGCSEEGLLKLSQDANYAGETLTINSISCTLTVTGSGTSRSIQAKAGSADTYIRNIQADVDWGLSFQIVSWQELSN